MHSAAEQMFPRPPRTGGIPVTEDTQQALSGSVNPPLSTKPAVVLFDVSKNEAGDPSSCYRNLCRALKQQGLQCRINEQSLVPANLQDVGVVVLAQPTQPFTASEFEALKTFFEQGGSLLILLGEGGELRAGTNVNYFLEEYGMTVCCDAVVRMTVASSTYAHPKEAFIGDGILCRDALNRCAQSKETGSSGARARDRSSASRGTGILCDVLHTHASEAQSGQRSVTLECGDEIPFLFPYGATVSVQKPAFPFLSSGITAHPSKRPLAAAYAHPGGGRLAAIGSYRIFDNDFLEKENNPRVQQLLFRWLLAPGGEEANILRPPTEDQASLEPSQPVPDTTSLAERPMPCFHETDEVLPSDFRNLFEAERFALDTSHIAEIRQLYRQLGVKYEPLTMIPPEIVVPLPRLRPAVHPPILPKIPPPPLELFDIDAEIASPRTRLVQLANQCTDDSDLEIHLQRAAYFVPVPLLPCEDMGIQAEDRMARNILCSLLYRVIELKRTDSASAATEGLREAS
ncbi:intraflagellar transport 52 (Protein NGD5) family protein [Besnoitia besnoiti]|uniref:Intraflagellar transport 52 (Protein NGD5) family protein n=1 Tax=Besnoitia besnoiti TaxID=94643 RepID=A0A2A9MD64_BESBE|nr:intraflagellar transport 52 (Protein NGD5) family protein [Besnoitia besnoiti]PFH33547.1 intraflagellar transport 52 (Protein NGD5) family protein [Besnoitia besnoiti]